MKLDDPSLWPVECPPPRFERVDDPASRDIYLLSTGDAVIAELAPLYNDHGILTADRDGHCPLPREGCWTLDLTWDESSVTETHLLCSATVTEVDADRTRELAAWATLVVLCVTNPNVAHRG